MHLLNKIVVPRIKAEWKDVAFSMGYEPHDVDAIDQDFRNLKQRCQYLFADWLGKNRDPTWKALLKYVTGFAKRGLRRTIHYIEL